MIILQIQQWKNKARPAIDYDSIHPPSPKISKGGTIKKSKVGTHWGGHIEETRRIIN